MKNKRRKESVPVASLLAWLLPGTGHFYAGYRLRGIVLFILIVGLFVCGLVMRGGILSTSNDLISQICGYGRAGVGLPWLLGLLPDLKFANMLSPFGEIGACYTTVAGLLNLLVVLSVRDLIRNRSLGSER